MKRLLLDEGTMLVYNAEELLSLIESVNFVKKTVTKQGGEIVPYTHIWVKEAPRSEDSKDSAKDRAIHDLIDTIEGAGGITHLANDNCSRVGDNTWIGLREAYFWACQALGRKPMAGTRDE